MMISAGKYRGMRRMADAGGRYKMTAVDQRPPINAGLPMKRDWKEAFTALRKLMGFAKLHRPVADARLEDGWSGRTDQRTTFLRVVAKRQADGFHARTTGPQGSAILSSMLVANALAVIPEGVARVEPGGVVLLHLTEEVEDH